jgi:N-acylneuraminate cytidylyltransferase/CMP-N,N'-diacetyllegionaminic acid synthase
MSEHTLITLCARGGSKGIPGKNIKLINGKPLLAYSIEQAMQLSKLLNGTVELSTDSEEIRAVARQYGLSSNYIRPEYLATDTIGKIDVLDAILNYAESANQKKYDFLIDLDVTSPLRSVEDVITGMKILNNNAQAINLFSVSKAHRNPYFNMVEKGDDGFFHLIKKGTFKTRQESPEVYDLNASFYIYRKAFFEQNYRGAITDRSLIYKMEHLCFDLDEPIDFEFMSYLLQNRKLDFDFNY